MSEKETAFYTDVEDESDFLGEEEESDRVTLRSGEAMTEEDVESFLLKKRASIISIVGEAHSGKTTLMCALYDRFLKGPFADLTFAGSRTIVGLERRSHHSRVESNSPSVETERTSLAENLLHYHFAVSRVGRPGRISHLLFTDRAGESYQQARSDTEQVSDLSELGRADWIAILLDGSRIAERSERANAMQNARQLIHAFLDNGGLGKKSRVQVITTKHDAIQRSDGYLTTKERLTEYQSRLTSDFSDRLASLTFASIAARDPTGEHPVGTGLEDLLHLWTQPRILVKDTQKPNFISPSTEMDLLLNRTYLQEWP